MESDSHREDSKEEFVKGIEDSQQRIDGRTTAILVLFSSSDLMLLK